MGFDLDLVQSDNTSHYECAICQNLVDLDCVVASPCTHCFCRKCLFDWLNTPKSKKSCPKCQTSLVPTEQSKEKETLLDDTGTSWLVIPMAQNRIAFLVLKAIKVMCPLSGIGCSWMGDYGDVHEHLFNRNIHPTIASVVSHKDSLLTRQIDYAIPQITGILVEDAGVDPVNGLYRIDGHFEGAPKFTKELLWEGNRANIHIHKCETTMVTHFWFISIPSDPSQLGTDKDLDFYSTCGCAGEEPVPPVFPAEWTELAQGQGPPPRLTFLFD